MSTSKREGLTSSNQAAKRFGIAYGAWQQLIAFEVIPSAQIRVGQRLYYSQADMVVIDNIVTSKTKGNK